MGVRAGLEAETGAERVCFGGGTGSSGLKRNTPRKRGGEGDEESERSRGPRTDKVPERESVGKGKGLEKEWKGVGSGKGPWEEVIVS